MRPGMICGRLKVLAVRFYKDWIIRWLRSFSPSAPSASPRETKAVKEGLEEDARVRTLRLVQKRLVNLIEQESLPENRKGRKGLEIAERAHAGEVLGHLGDPRPGVGVIEVGRLAHPLPDLRWGTEAWSDVWRRSPTSRG